MGNPSCLQSGLGIIAQSVGGYQGYEAESSRRESDQKVRKHLLTEIGRLIQALSKVSRAAQGEDAERLGELLSSNQRKMDTVAQSLKKPTYASASFFHAEKLGAKRLSRIYDFERTMLEEMSHIADEIKSLHNHTLEREVFEEHFLHIADFIDSVNQSLFEREAQIIGDDGIF